jgi:hypothetical protein
MTMAQPDATAYDPAADPVHGSGWNSAARWGGWSWREPRDGEWFRTCSFCGCIHPEDLAPELVPEGPCSFCGKVGWEAHFLAMQPAWYGQLRESGQLAAADVPPEEIARLDACPPEHPYCPGGAYASWADRKYGWPHKFYVNSLKSRDPERLFVVSSHRPAKEGPYAPGGEHYRPPQETSPGLRWVTPSEIPEGTVTEGWGDFEDCDLVALGTKPDLFAKFYTVHLKDPAIGQDVKDAVQRASGLRLTWLEDDRVQWEAWKDEAG